MTDRTFRHGEYAYEPPRLSVLGSVEELTLGSGVGFPDTCDLAVGPVLGADPCKGQMGKTQA